MAKNYGMTTIGAVNAANRRWMGIAERDCESFRLLARSRGEMVSLRASPFPILCLPKGGAMKVKSKIRGGWGGAVGD